MNFIFRYNWKLFSGDQFQQWKPIPWHGDFQGDSEGFSPAIGTFLKQEQAPQSLLECTSKVNLNHIVFFKK